MIAGDRHAGAPLASCIALLLAPQASGDVVALEEVVVTARRIEESRWRVPLSIDAIPADALPSGLPLDLDRLAALSPGLYFESLWGGTGSAPVLRGQSQPSTAGDNVGVFVDGVYQGERTAIDTSPIDLERVEIVRGPQSTLFGRSTFAGAIHYVPRLPSREFTAGVEMTAGTDEYASINGYASGALVRGMVLGRLAAGYRDTSGTLVNDANGERLGGARRSAVAGMLMSDWDGSWRVRLSGRWSGAALGHPASSTVGGHDYNCGAVDPATNLWSYYCGPLPAQERYSISPGIPDSQLDVGQASLVIQWNRPALEFNSVTSYYIGDADRYRDFDASATGERFGVCAQPACPRGSGPPQPVIREANVDAVSRVGARTTEWTQEITLRGTPEGSSWSWLVGVMAFISEQSSRAAFGFARGDLLANERLTALLPQTPAIAGPVARANSFLVDDPDREQVRQSDVESEVRSEAIYGALDYRFDERWAMRIEARATHERLETMGNVNSPQGFTDTTPRASLQWEPFAGTLVYASAAKGSRSGGINSTVGLSPDEQTFEPEYNWTYELGARKRESRWSAEATLYYIDWTNTQLLGFPVTPGINTLITRNTAGVRTQGVELEFEARLFERLMLRAAYAHAASEFALGSDDPGSASFCGLKGANVDSSFCDVGPPRSGAAAIGTYVPYIDGNRLPRAPKNQLALNLTADLAPSGWDWTLDGAIDLSYQDDVYDRAINGASFGERTLLSARLTWARGSWIVQLWGTNLTDDLHVRAIGSRGAAFYPISPRPLDLLYGDGRRVGLTLRYEL